ncbi:MAG: hypothetical protein Tsb009_39740 [Planctomycetaceae bacterium]
MELSDELDLFTTLVNPSVILPSESRMESRILPKESRKLKPTG